MLERKTSKELMLLIVRANNVIRKMDGGEPWDTAWLEAEVRKEYIDRILVDLEDNTNSNK